MSLPRMAVIVLALLAARVASAAEDYYTLRIGAVKPAIDVRLRGSGKSIRWEDLDGKVVVIDFWATWCVPCREAIPKLNALEKEFKGKPVRFISITYEPESKIAPFLAKYPMETDVAIDNDFATFRSFKAWGIPAVYLFDRQGKVIGVFHPNKLGSDVLNTALQGRVPDVEQSRGWNDPTGAEKYFRSLLEKKADK